MLDPLQIITTVGLIGIFLIVFFESGILVGFFLPGDSLLFTAGILASQGVFPIYILLPGCILAAILGDSVGYWTGKNMGRKLFEKDAGFFFKKKRLYDAENFYQKHGKYTIIIARFIPMIRTFAPIVAGVVKMPYKIFLSYNIFGGIFWPLVIIFLGYFMGNIIPDPDLYIIPIVIGVIFLSVIPIIITFLHNKFSNKNYK